MTFRLFLLFMCIISSSKDSEIYVLLSLCSLSRTALHSVTLNRHPLILLFYLLALAQIEFKRQCNYFPSLYIEGKRPVHEIKGKQLGEVKYFVM